MPVPKNKRELQAFLGIINYLGKFSPGMVEVCEPLWKLTSSKATWTWNISYQQLFEKAKSLIKVDVCMKFCNNTKLLYLETDASGVGLQAALLQLCDNTCQKDRVPDNVILCPIAFASKSFNRGRVKIQQHWERGTGHITWLGKMSPLLFWQRGNCHLQPQTIGVHV